MKQKKTKKDKMVAFKEYNTERITKAAYKPTPLNTDLTENPFLLDQDKYKYISFKIKNYNKKI